MDSAHPKVFAVAGINSSGTNFLFKHWLLNAATNQCGVACFQPRWSYIVNGSYPWLGFGKHTLLRHLTKTGRSLTATCLNRHDSPVDTLLVAVRDPLRWIRSMCGTGYKNIRFRITSSSSSPASPKCAGWRNTTVQYNSGRKLAVLVKESFQSIVHVYNAYYADLVRLADDPGAKPRVVFVRYEDLVLRASETTQALCSCMSGAVFSQDVAVRVKAANPRESPNEPPPRDHASVHRELSSANSTEELLAWFDPQDLSYILRNLDAALMERLGYPQYVRPAYL